MELMFVSTVFASVSQILLKKSAIKQYDHWLKAYLNPLVIVAYTLLGLSVIFNILAFRDIHYKWGPVIASLSYVFVPIASFFIFKEKMNAKIIIGMILIIGGIIVFGYTP